MDMEFSRGKKGVNNVRIVELKKIKLPENSVKIQDILYWNVLTQLYEDRRESEWYELSQMELDEMWLGLKEIRYEGSFFDGYRFFEVIDKQKYLWARLKYGI